jgi:hypothetical protein
MKKIMKHHEQSKREQTSINMQILQTLKKLTEQIDQ